MLFRQAAFRQVSHVYHNKLTDVCIVHPPEPPPTSSRSREGIYSFQKTKAIGPTPFHQLVVNHSLQELRIFLLWAAKENRKTGKEIVRFFDTFPQRVVKYVPLAQSTALYPEGANPDASAGRMNSHFVPPLLSFVRVAEKGGSIMKPIINNRRIGRP
jgi:hypothetical protein